MLFIDSIFMITFIDSYKYGFKKSHLFDLKIICAI